MHPCRLEPSIAASARSSIPAPDRVGGGETGVQITFLAGNRRHIVLVMHDEAPADYDAEIALAERAYRRAVKHE